MVQSFMGRKIEIEVCMLDCSKVNLAESINLYYLDCHIRQVREIWLSSEDTGAYGRDLGTNLPELLESIVEVLPQDGRTMLRHVKSSYAFDSPQHLISNSTAQIDYALRLPLVQSFV